jgi:ACT domain-containing protein
MKVDRKKDFLNEMKSMPIIEVACSKVGISRQTYYRWINNSSQFKEEVEKARKVGIDFVSDMTEAELINLVQRKQFPAIAFWLRHRHAEYRSKVEVTTIEKDKELTEEQKEIINQTIKQLTENV